MRRTAVVSTCSLNLWALDFEHNLRLIELSIAEAKRRGARFRTGPELEITGYSCADHFFESDTQHHSWQALIRLLSNTHNHGILYDVGMPVSHGGALYNCRLMLLDGKVLFIRPKQVLCDDGSYSETRWFTAWTRSRELDEFRLPEAVQAVTGQQSVPIGDALISTRDTCIGHEICEELWNTDSRHIQQGLAGAEIFVNSSGSVREMGVNADRHRLSLMTSCTYKAGGCYIFSNLKGSDGDRFLFGGNASIIVNGELVALTSPFEFTEVDVLTTAVDLDEIRVYRLARRSRCLMAAAMKPFPKVEVDFFLCLDTCSSSCSIPSTMAIEPVLPTDQDEVLEGLALWLWDYLRRSGKGGYLLPLTGGLDSTVTALVVFSMCRKIVKAIGDGNETVLKDLRRVLNEDSPYKPLGPRELCGRLLQTLLMTVEEVTDEESRVERLAALIGSTHRTVNVSAAVAATVAACHDPSSSGARKLSEEETTIADHRQKLDETIDRLRMTTAYHCAQPPLPGRQLAVLGCSNLEQLLIGLPALYGLAWGDLNPMRGVSRTHLEAAALAAVQRFGIPELSELLPATTEVQLRGATSQELNACLTYQELSTFGQLRKGHGCGPYSMFCKLVALWPDIPPHQVSVKVKYFFREYGRCRSKMAAAAPGVHLETSDSEDGRNDFRPLVYNNEWTWQFQAIDDAVSGMAKK